MKDTFLQTLGLAVRARKVKFGAFTVKKAVNDGICHLVIIPTDLGEDNKKKLKSVCEINSVKLVMRNTKKEFESALGKENVTAVAVCDESFATALLKKTEVI